MGIESLTTKSNSNTSGIRVADDTAFEKYTNPALLNQYKDMESMLKAGAGESDVAAGAGGVRDYADMLKRFSTPEGIFGAQQAGVDNYTKLGEQIFGGQMRQQQQESQRLAARLGRPGSDPVLQAKLAQQRSDTVGAFAAQQAMGMPQQMAQYSGMRSEALQGLAGQAMSNRQAILGLGSQLREQDRKYRIDTGERYSNSTSTGSIMDVMGGVAGMAGSIMGGMTGMGAIGGLASKGLGMLGGGGGGGGLGDTMSGMLGVGGGSSPGQGAGGFMGNLGSFMGGAARGGGIMPQGQPSQSRWGNGATADYSMPVGQSYDVFQQPSYNMNMGASGFAAYPNAQTSPMQSFSPSRQSMMLGRGF